MKYFGDGHYGEPQNFTKWHEANSPEIYEQASTRKGVMPLIRPARCERGQPTMLRAEPHARKRVEFQQSATERVAPATLDFSVIVVEFFQGFMLSSDYSDYPDGVALRELGDRTVMS